MAPQRTDTYDPWGPDAWVEAGLASTLGLPKRNGTIPVSLGPDSVFQTAQQVQKALDLTFLPRTINATVTPSKVVHRPPGSSSAPQRPTNVVCCLVPGDAWCDLVGICNVRTGGFVPIDGKSIYLHIPTAFVDELTKTLTRTEEQKARDRADKQVIEKYADFWARKDEMTRAERIAWMREEIGKLEAEKEANNG
ncbi:hypothetical protein SPBR_01044 [Sporothrix brasiliensis 5110]|uniref:Uncharacterized protein n=1 Tax=Sporothrix brasiliensis 5110 TaxID=1398154 RepID=A0A0C2IPL8_9PEZI|nr:uncharacterized protein SPBR_01044 [Sporothrix brasiliensis 5110]KIH90976.1 hypothetical protein SPBR_01044 [Sporothrix brasiliensis 5110]